SFRWSSSRRSTGAGLPSWSASSWCFSASSSPNGGCEAARRGGRHGLRRSVLHASVPVLRGGDPGRGGDLPLLRPKRDSGSGKRDLARCAEAELVSARRPGPPGERATGAASTQGVAVVEARRRRDECPGTAAARRRRDPGAGREIREDRLGSEGPRARLELAEPAALIAC